MFNLNAQNYKGAANAFVEALKLDPENVEIKTALRQ
jgi:cytochrome c-type biogenesis protein CcmH/NrfG